MSEQSLLLEIKSLATRVAAIERALERSGTSLSSVEGTIPIEVESADIQWNYIVARNIYHVIVPAHCPRCDRDVKISIEVSRQEQDGAEHVLKCPTPDCSAELRARLWHNLFAAQEAKRGKTAK